MLESLANHLVCAQKVGSGYTLAVGRVGDDNTLLFGLREVLEVGMCNSDVLAESGCLHIHVGSVHCLHVDIISVDMVSELAFL